MKSTLWTRRSTLAVMLATSFAGSNALAAEDWPSRPITLVVSSAAGSGVDTLAREMAKKLGETLQQPVVVDNKPGGAGAIAGSAVARAPADGYTLLYSNASFIAVVPAIMKKMSYDTVKDLSPIAQTAAGGVILSVNKDVPATDLSELIALVKANPNKYNYGTWGVGSSAHLIMEWLQKNEGLKMTHIPYKSTPQIVADLASGALQVGWTDPATPVAMLEAGKLKGIAISGNVRAPRTGQIGTMAEQKHPFSAVGWFGVFGPAGLPKPIAERLNAEINKIQSSPDMATRMSRMNLEPAPQKSVDEFRDIIDSDIKVWAQIAKDAQVTK